MLPARVIAVFLLAVLIMAETVTSLIFPIGEELLAATEESLSWDATDIGDASCEKESLSLLVMKLSKGRAYVSDSRPMGDGECVLILERRRMGSGGDEGFREDFQNAEPVGNAALGFLLKDGTLALGPVYNSQGEFLPEKYGDLLFQRKLRGFYGRILSLTERGGPEKRREGREGGREEEIEEGRQEEREVGREEGEEAESKAESPTPTPAQCPTQDNIPDANIPLTPLSDEENPGEFSIFSFSEASWASLLGKKLLFVFFDPLCPYSKALLKGPLPKLLDDFGAASLWVPVSLLKGSLPYGESFLRTGSLPEMRKGGEDLGRETIRGSSFKKTWSRLSLDAAEMVRKNTLNFAGLFPEGEAASPVLIYKEGGELRVLKGVPEDKDLEKMKIEPFGS
jgi:hypothetical protein